MGGGLIILASPTHLPVLLIQLPRGPRVVGLADEVGSKAEAIRRRVSSEADELSSWVEAMEDRVGHASIRAVRSIVGNHVLRG